MQQRLGFLKGMQTDLSPQKMSPDNYLDALNISLSSDNTGTIGSITNAKGTNLLFKLPDVIDNFYSLDVIGIVGGGKILTIGAKVVIEDGGLSSVSNNQELYALLQTITLLHVTVIFNGGKILIRGTKTTAPFLTVSSTSDKIVITKVSSTCSVKLCGWGSFQNTIMLLTKERTTSASRTGQLWKLNYNPEFDSIINVHPTTKLLSVPDHLLYSFDGANFPDDKPIQEIIFRYKNENSIKMYWVDGVNLLRHIDIMKDHTSTVPTALNVVSYIDMREPSEVTEEPGGYYTAGRIQYCYQLFNLDGSESLISPATRMYSIVPNIEGFSSVGSRGAEPETNCNKSFRVTVDNLDSRFELIRLFSIHYTQPNGDPSIRVVHESSIKGASIDILDTGAVSLEEYSLSEFRVLNNRFVVPRTITSKDNRLILGNVTEDYFDVESWDARAYRFKEMTVGQLTGAVYKIDGNVYRIWGSVQSFGDTIYKPFNLIDEQADCVWDDDEYIYDKDISKLGGSGTNISYEFITEDVVIDTEEDNKFEHKVGKAEENSYFANDKSLFMGYSPLEIYRFGIVFVDGLGRNSFVKWIADVKFPEFYDLGINNSVFIDGDNVVTKSLGIKFIVGNIPPTLKFFIVRVKREEYDKSVIAQGILSIVGTSTSGTGSYDHQPSLFSLGNINNYVNNVEAFEHTVEQRSFIFYSPEVSFNKNINIPDTSSFLWSDYMTIIKNITSTPLSNKGVQKSDIRQIGVPRNGLSLRIEDLIVVNNDKYLEYTYIPGRAYRNLCRSKDGTINKTAGSGLLIYLEDDFLWGIPYTNPPAPLEDAYIVGYIVNNVFGKQYGGNRLTNRVLNSYIKCSNIIEYSSGDVNINVFSGDVFTQYFSFLYSARQEGSSGFLSFGEIAHIPLQTSIDLYNREDLNPNSKFFKGSGNILAHETVAAGVEEYGEDYPTFYTDLYLYNKTYSREGDAQLYFPKPFYADFNKDFLNRVMISNKHLGVELSDPWLKYPFDQYTDVDSVYGQVTKLLNFKDNIVFFQNKAFGVIPINEKRLLSPQSQEESPLTLGTGDLISDYKYLSERSGCQNVYSAIKTDKGIYWLDMINRKFNVWSGEGVQSLSDNLGVNNLFTQYYYNSIENLSKLLLGDGVHLSHNSKTNTVVITMVASGEDRSGANTITFNELLGVFESRHTMLPKILLDLGNVTLGADFKSGTNYIDSGYSLFKGMVGKVFDKTTVYPTEIKLIANDNPLFRKVFTNLEFNSNITGKPQKTISNIVVSNNNQLSNNITLIPEDNIIRRGTTWRLAIPRSQQQNDRMRDYYMAIKLGYNNTDGDIIVLDDIIVHYMIPAL